MYIFIKLQINGIRFVDKTQFEKGRIIMFRFEIWINKKASDEERNKLKDYLKDEMECPSIEVKNIDVKQYLLSIYYI